MQANLSPYKNLLPIPLRDLPWRAHPLDGKLLLFERNTGLNVLLEGDEVAHLRWVAPRTLLIAVTNHCNLACPFCYRDLRSASEWTYASLLSFCQQADQWGVLEVAFGGGEPLIFPRWQSFILDLYETTRLCINFTTNGMLLTEDFLTAVDGRYGQIRLSTYQDNHWEETVRLLARCNARFGINWLITPVELAHIEERFARLLELGVRDFLLLSYKGSDWTLHLDAGDCQHLETFMVDMHERLGDQVTLKLGICWGNELPNVPRLFEMNDCGAGDDFISITSDRQIKPCSFHHLSEPFETLADVRAWWERRHGVHLPALVGGCARLSDWGLAAKGVRNNEDIHLAAVQQ